MKKTTRTWWQFNCRRTREELKRNGKYNDGSFDLRTYGNLEEAIDFFFTRESYPQSYILVNYDQFFKKEKITKHYIQDFKCSNAEISYVINLKETFGCDICVTFTLNVYCLKHKGGYDLNKAKEFIKKFDEYVINLRG